MKNVILSGIRPTGKPGPNGSLHIGNLFGAILQFVELQSKPNNSCFFFVADYHALTDLPPKGLIGELTQHIILMYLAAGLDPQRSTIYIQSHIPEIMELEIILRNFASLGNLLSLPTFKDKLGKVLRTNNATTEKATKALGANMGLVGYPLLMAADIIGPSSTVIPVGEDQLPHIELTREIIRAFNRMYGDVFTMPEARISEAPRVPGLDGKGKMGKTDENSILILDPADVIRAKLRRAVTDHGRQTKNDPGNPNNCASIFPLHNLSALTDDKGIQEIISGCQKAVSEGGLPCVECKKALAEKLIRLLEPIRRRYRDLEQDPNLVRKVTEQGAEKVRQIIAPILSQAKRAIGLYT